MSPIRVRDLVGGTISDRPRNAPTIDLPPDFDRAVGLVTVDTTMHGHYRAHDGKNVSYAAFVRPLSWRASGEIFLIGDAGGERAPAGTFRLSSIAVHDR